MGKVTRRVVLDNFAKIAAIPRPSLHEEGIAKFLVDWGTDHSFKSYTDDTHNVVVSVPASPGRENEPTVAIQGHIDVVCEKAPGVKHDFQKDPVKVVKDGNWLRAEGTTLGADDGIAMAIGMAMATDASHPALEIFGTAGEEIGMVGATAFAPGILKATRLINIDSEEDGIFYIGCAGGAAGETFIPVERTQPPEDADWAHIVIGGLAGGHSGMEISKYKGNALQIATRLLVTAQKFAPGVGLEMVQGGSADNAIPRDAEFIIAIPKGEHAMLHPEMQKTIQNLQTELLDIEPGMTIKPELLQNHTPAPVITGTSLKNLLAYMQAKPFGIFQRNMKRGGLVEASTNFAAVKTEESQVRILSSQRGNYNSIWKSIVAREKALADLAGARYEVTYPYPCWTPNFDSPLVATASKAYKELFGSSPEIEVIHAGLECGMIGSKYPNLDMVSYGPTITEAHTPKEALDLKTLDKCIALTEKLLEKS